MDTETIFLIEDLRRPGSTWDEVNLAMDSPAPNGDALRKRYNRAVAAGLPTPNVAFGAARDGAVPVVEAEAETSLRDVRTVDDLIARLNIDTKVYTPEIINLRMSEWDQANGEKGEAIRVSAQLKRNRMTPDDVHSIWASYLVDVQKAADPPEIDRAVLSALSDEVLCILGVFDPHFGMLAHHEVVGDNYDLRIADIDYVKVSLDLLGRAHQFYRPDQVCLILGNDLFHANAMTDKTAVTRRGTPQDFDGRFHEVFTRVRQACVQVIDAASRMFPCVDVVIVPGNHDHDECYRLGEVLNAWYRGTGGVEVRFGANKRFFYHYGNNAFMFTHGEEYKRKRDNLPMIFLSEMPDSMRHLSYREVITGHNHAAMAGGYYPTGELSESRRVRVRSLPGLTGTDAWHHEEGYKHHRAGTLLAYSVKGGLIGLHEAQPGGERC